MKQLEIKIESYLDSDGMCLRDAWNKGWTMYLGSEYVIYWRIINVTH